MNTVQLIYQMATGLLTIASSHKRIVLNGIRPATVKCLVLTALHDKADFTIEFVA